MNQMEDLRAVMHEASEQAHKRFPSLDEGNLEDRIRERCRFLMMISTFVHEATDEQLRQLVEIIEPSHHLCELKDECFIIAGEIAGEIEEIEELDGREATECAVCGATMRFGYCPSCDRPV